MFDIQTFSRVDIYLKLSEKVKGEILIIHNKQLFVKTFGEKLGP